MDILCILHDSDEYGIVRWPLADLARSAGVSIKSANELSEKKVLKGSDNAIEAFTYTPHHAGQAGETVTLIAQCSGPCWFSSRLVTDEWIRQRRGETSRFPKPTPKATPKGGIGDVFGDVFGDGPTSSSTSSPSKSNTGRMAKPSLESVKLAAEKAGLPAAEAEKFFNYYESNGWRVGKNPMRSWTHALTNWKNNYYEKRSNHPKQHVDRSKGTANEGKASQYAGLGDLVHARDTQRPAA